jgi:hypothetical protein
MGLSVGASDMGVGQSKTLKFRVDMAIYDYI